MIRMWAKIMKGQKIQKNLIYESIDNFNKETFYLHIQEICHRLDIATPVVLNYHTNNYVNFNNCIFSSRDFVETIPFDKLVIEEASIK